MFGLDVYDLRIVRCSIIQLGVNWMEMKNYTGFINCSFMVVLLQLLFFSRFHATVNTRVWLILLSLTYLFRILY